MNKVELQQLIDDGVKQVLSEAARQRGLKGGPARAKALSPRRRREIARKAARARWAKREKPA